MEDENDKAFGRVVVNVHEIKNLSFADDFTPGNTDDSRSSTLTPQEQDESWRADGYLASLEAKLQRLNGKSRNVQHFNQRLTSRDMLRALDDARHDSARHLISSNSAHEFDEDYDPNVDAQVSALKRKMFPEQALSAEELQELVRRDFLQLATQDASEEAEAADQTKGDSDARPSR